MALAAALSAMLVSGCETEAEQRKRIERGLPSGCRLIDLGEYQSIDHLVVIDCASGTTVNGVKRVWTGKVYYERTFATFKEKDASND